MQQCNLTGVAVVFALCLNGSYHIGFEQIYNCIVSAALKLVFQTSWHELLCFSHGCQFSRKSIGPQRLRVNNTASTSYYQSSRILTILFQHNIINVSYLAACYLYQVMMTLHFFNDVANDAESTQKSKITS